MYQISLHRKNLDEKLFFLGLKALTLSAVKEIWCTEWNPFPLEAHTFHERSPARCSAQGQTVNVASDLLEQALDMTLFVVRFQIFHTFVSLFFTFADDIDDVVAVSTCDRHHDQEQDRYYRLHFRLSHFSFAFSKLAIDVVSNQHLQGAPCKQQFLACFGGWCVHSCAY